MNVLVTGGAGYIGSVVAARLLEGGHQVTVLDDLSTGHRDAVPAGALLVVAKVEEAAPLMAEQRFDAVVHLAASSLVAESIADPAKYQRNNVEASRVLLEGAQRAGIGRFVFSSSAAVYGEPAQVPIEENAPARPVNPYGASKLAVDHLLQEAASSSAIETVSLRYFNVAGSYEGFGERHNPETHLIPLVLKAAMQGAPVTVFGDDYPTPDGTCVRDYVHVADVADAHLLALHLAPSSGWSVYNLGNSEGFSVRQVIDAARRVTGRKLPEQVAPRREGDPAILVASSSRAQRELGWVPQRARLDDMVADSWRFATAVLG